MNAINNNVFELPAKKTRVKRTEQDMLASVKGNAFDEASYVRGRLMKLEEKMSELLGSASPEAQEMLSKSLPHLSRYLP